VRAGGFEKKCKDVRHFVIYSGEIRITTITEEEVHREDYFCFILDYLSGP
jgi:hypothetical protein